MDYTEIEAAALELEKEDRVALLEALTDSLRSDAIEQRDPRLVVAQVESATGQDLNTKGRQYEQVLMRAVIAYRLRYEQRMTYCEIGDAIARDHSTIGYYLDRMKSALEAPAMWPGYMETYNKSKTL